MSTLNSTLSYTVYVLHVIKEDFLVYLPLVFIILGLIGFIGNVFTFLQPTLRVNSCCIYLLFGSFVDVINLLMNLLTNYVHVRTDYILSLVTTRHICKLKLFGLVFLPQLSLNILTLSLIDRFACTCSLTSSIRLVRQLKMVPWMILITIIISGVLSIYSPINYDVEPTLGCICKHRILNGFLYVILHGVVTPSVMLMFVLLTYRNVKRSRHRAVNIFNIHY